MSFPGTPKKFRPQCSQDEIRLAAAAIAGKVKMLADRREEMGDYFAFIPDEDTNAVFADLWKVSFDQDYSPRDQQRIIEHLRTHHQGTIETMRAIGHESERAMEIGYAKQVIEAAKKIKDTSLAERWEEIRGRGWSLSRQAEMAEEEGDSTKRTANHWEMESTVVPEMNKLNDDRKALLEKLTASFPYPTYETLSSSEIGMLGTLKGMHPDRFRDEVHLVIEAGALPLTALYLAINYNEPQVYCFIKDEESYEVARELVGELERIGILRPQAVHIYPFDPLSPHFGEALKQMKARGGRPANYHSAIITQLVQGREEVQQLARTLIEEVGIDTIVVRGAHQMVELLYEPLDKLALPGGVKQRLTAVPQPRGATEGDMAHNDVVMQHAFPCYNTSHVYSRYEVDRGKVAQLSDRNFLYTIGGNGLTAA